jgi:hypothetical protein
MGLSITVTLTVSVDTCECVYYWRDFDILNQTGHLAPSAALLEVSEFDTVDFFGNYLIY